MQAHHGRTQGWCGPRRVYCEASQRNRGAPPLRVSLHRGLGLAGHAPWHGLDDQHYLASQAPWHGLEGPSSNLAPLVQCCSSARLGVPCTPPGMDSTSSNWLRSSVPMFVYLSCIGRRRWWLGGCCQHARKASQGGGRWPLRVRQHCCRTTVVGGRRVMDSMGGICCPGAGAAALRRVETAR